MSTNSDSSSDSSTTCKTKAYVNRQVIIDTSIWCFVCIPVLVFFIWGVPYTQGFTCDDTSIRLPYKRNTISTPALLTAGLTIPIAMILLTELLSMNSDKDNPLKAPRLELIMALKGVAVFLFGTMVNKVFTEITKYSVGRLRPNFIDVCKPDFSNINCTQGYITEYTCTTTEHDDREIRDSRLSFPSGHASFGVFCSVYTVLYIQARLKVSSSHFLKPTIQSALLLLSVWCCLTRVTDHKHFTSDVIAGSIMGIVAAWLTFYKVGVPIFNKTTTPPTKSDVERAYSVNSETEPATPDPLLRSHTCSFYLDDPVADKNKSIR